MAASINQQESLSLPTGKSSMSRRMALGGVAFVAPMVLVACGGEGGLVPAVKKSSNNQNPLGAVEKTSGSGISATNIDETEKKDKSFLVFNSTTGKWEYKDYTAIMAVVAEISDAHTTDYTSIKSRFSALDTSLTSIVAQVSAAAFAASEITSARNKTGSAAAFTTLSARLDSIDTDVSASKIEINDAKGASSTLKARLDVIVASIPTSQTVSGATTINTTAAITTSVALTAGSITTSGASSLAAVTATTGAFSGIVSGADATSATHLLNRQTADARYLMPGGNLTVGGTLSAIGTSTLAAVNSSSITTTGAGSVGSTLNVGTTLAVAGNTTLSGTLSAVGASTLAAITSTTINASGLVTLAAGAALPVSQTLSGAGVINTTGAITTSLALTAGSITTAGATSLAAVTATTGVFSGVVSAADATVGTHLLNRNTADARYMPTSGNVTISGTLSAAGTSTLAAVNASSITTTGAGSIGTTLAVAGASTLAAITSTTISATGITATTINASGLVTLAAGAALPVSQTLSGAGVINTTGAITTSVALTAGSITTAGASSLAAVNATTGTFSGVAIAADATAATHLLNRQTADARYIPTGGNVTISGTLSATGTSTLAAINASSITTSGAGSVGSTLNVGTTLAVTGNTTLSGTLSAVGASTLAAITSTTITATTINASGLVTLAAGAALPVSQTLSGAGVINTTGAITTQWRYRVDQ